MRLLFRSPPGPARRLPTLAFVVVAAVGFEIVTVFYNAMLPDIADRARIGRISGWGWGLGYLGGLACMILSLVGFVQTDDPWFGVGTEDAANIRATVLLVAAWYAVDRKSTRLNSSH